MLNKYSEAIRGNLNKNQRSKVVALVTIEVHARDVIDKLIKTNTNDVTAFEWLQQLRLYWDKVRFIPTIDLYCCAFYDSSWNILILLLIFMVFMQAKPICCGDYFSVKTCRCHNVFVL